MTAKPTLGTEPSVGELLGRIVVEGEVPSLPPLRVSPDLQQPFEFSPTIEQRAKIEAAKVKIEDRSLLVGKDGGLNNAFVYLRKPPAGFKPQPNEQHQATVEIRDFKTIHPRAQIVRVGWDFRCANKHDQQANLRIYPLGSKAFNALIPSGEDFLRFGKFTKAESVPTTLSSNMVPAVAFVLAVDHPFAAVTDEAGRCQVSGLPPGEHTFRVWHEKVGFLPELNVTIRAGEKTEITHTAPASHFLEKEVSTLQSPAAGEEK